MKELTRKQMHIELFGEDAPRWCRECLIVWDEYRRVCVYCGCKTIRRDGKEDDPSDN